MPPKNCSITSLWIAIALLWLLWLALTATLAWQEWLVGLLVAVLVGVISRPRLGWLDDVRWSPWLVVYVLRYVMVFLIALLRSNLDMARRVLSPSLPINPAVVEVSTGLQSELGKLLLANSITLTPGTLTVDVNADRLTIHWVDATPGEDLYHATQEIATEFEKYLAAIVR